MPTAGTNWARQIEMLGSEWPVEDEYAVESYEYRSAPGYYPSPNYSNLEH